MNMLWHDFKYKWFHVHILNAEKPHPNHIKVRPHTVSPPIHKSWPELKTPANSSAYLVWARSPCRSPTEIHKKNFDRKCHIKQKEHEYELYILHKNKIQEATYQRITSNAYECGMYFLFQRIAWALLLKHIYVKKFKNNKNTCIIFDRNKVLEKLIMLNSVNKNSV